MSWIWEYAVHTRQIASSVPCGSYHSKYESDLVSNMASSYQNVKPFVVLLMQFGYANAHHLQLVCFSWSETISVISWSFVKCQIPTGIDTLLCCLTMAVFVFFEQKTVCFLIFFVQVTIFLSCRYGIQMQDMKLLLGGENRFLLYIYDLK